MGNFRLSLLVIILITEKWSELSPVSEKCQQGGQTAGGDGELHFFLGLGF